MTITPTQDQPTAGGPPATEAEAQGARRAASLIVLRDAAQGPEVLLLRRAERDGDNRSGVWVFPGGVLDSTDPALQAVCEGPGDAEVSARLGLVAGGLDYQVAALRECFEEVGLLYADGDLQAAMSERSAVQTGADFAELCRRHGLRLATGGLHYFSHWLTPPGLAKRFDTRFFVARAPLGQDAVADGGEAQELAWITPAAALDAAARFKFLPVTRRTLEELAAWPTVQSVLDHADSRRTIVRHMPRLGRDARGLRPVLQDEPAWAEIGRLDPLGRGDVACDLQPLRAVRLSERVRRITCNNGSMMTGPGTNTYLLRAPGSDEVSVLDPGPDDRDTEAHLQAVLAAAAEGPRPGRIVRIFVTHTHKDHSPAARRLAELSGARLIGRLASHPEWQDASFEPDQLPSDGQRYPLGQGCTLRAVATPGHASNHICWLLEEEKLLFTGDHVMQGSTVVINPPDGDMAAYLGSLKALMALDLDWLAPGHGFLMAEPRAVMAALVAHRLAREAKVLAALQKAGAVTLEALLPAVYGDVPATRHGVAARSLLAHLLYLAQQGRAAQRNGLWLANSP